MKKLYWRPQKVSLTVLWILAVISLSGLLMIEYVKVRERQPFYMEKMKAAKLARIAFDTIKKERLNLGLPINTEADPAESGFIGVLLSPVTTNPGHLPAKQTSINPNFAAVAVHLLKRAGVEKGDSVGLGLSGSFPALNICVLAAIQILELKPVIISSAGSSQWGANIPELMWPDMENILFKKRIFSFKSVAASRGGIDDKALGLSKEGKKAIDESINRNGIPFLNVVDYQDSLDKRYALYRENLNDEIRVYINIGGGTTSVGTRVGKTMFKPGLNRSAPRGAAAIDSIISRFAIEGAPIIHFTRIDDIAAKHGLPLQPLKIPGVGEGKVFVKEVYNPWLVVSLLFTILLLLFAFVRMDWAYRILSMTKPESKTSHPEKMV